MSSSSRFLSVVAILLAATSLISCSKQEWDKFSNKAQNSVTQDREMDYNRDDFRSAMAPRPVDESRKETKGDSVPDLAPVISEDKKNILPQPLVSISVNQDVPLRDIFFELAKQAEVDLELDPTITGSVIFTAYNRPFDQVVERISDIAGLRYKFKNNILRVERDTPYSKTYRVDNLSVTRDYTSTINSNTSTASAGGGGNNGSNSAITTKSNADFWKDLENNITQIISNTNQQVSLTDQSAPITTQNAIPAVSTADLAAVPAQGAAAPAPVPGAPAAAGSAVAPVAGLLNPTGTQTIAGEASASGGATAQLTNPYFSVNKNAGLVNVFATEKQHEKVSAYLSELRRSTNMQVLIEAKVFEVELNDQSASGINWGLFTDSGNLGAQVSLDRLSFPSDPVLSSQGGVFAYTGSNNFNIIVDALQRFGTVRTLSSPRISAMNNQTAVLNVSESRVFFEIKINRTEGTANNGGQRTEVTSTIKNVPEGVIITVQPSIDPDTKEITMNLRPSITRIVRSVSDPAAAYISGGDIENLVPELSVREIDSVVRMRSGSTIVMGGLMQDRTDSRQQGIPVLSETPLIGPLFRHQLDGIRKTEMVIMLRATVSDQSNPDETDKELYKKMSNDRHAFDM